MCLPCDPLCLSKLWLVFLLNHLVASGLSRLSHWDSWIWDYLTFDTMFLWGEIKCVTWTNRERSKICECNCATDHFRDSAYMEKLECLIVHGPMPSVSSSSFLSLATLTICTILLMFMTARLFANEVDYYKHFSMQWQNSDRGSRWCHSYIIGTQSGGERRG